MIRLQPLTTTPELCEYLSENHLRLTFTDLNPVSRGSGLESWVTVRWQGTIPDAHIVTRGTYNLKGARTVSTLTAEICQDPVLRESKDIVREVVNQAVADVIAVFYDQHNTRFDDGEQEPETRWLLRPLLEQGAVTRLVAQGGTLKSLFALAVGITIAADTPKLLGLRPVSAGPALYLDWEGDFSTFRERLRALCRAASMPVPTSIGYTQMRGPLYLSQRRVAAAVDDLAPAVVIVDSNAMARGSSGEGSAEDSTIRTFGVLRSLGTSVLVIDHKSDEKIRRGMKGGYGSVFNRNLSRLEWEVVRTAPTTDSLSIVMRLEKANNVRTGKELGFRFEITTNDQDKWTHAKVLPIDPNSVIALPGLSNSNAEAIGSWLSTQTEAQTVAAIATATKLTAAQVRKALNQEPARFENIGSATGGGGKGGLWRVYGECTDDGESIALPDPY